MYCYRIRLVVNWYVSFVSIKNYVKGNIMTLGEIEKRLTKIFEMRGDYEIAHSEEDKLYFDFIQYVASCNGKFSKRANLILSSKMFNFARYCA